MYLQIFKTEGKGWGGRALCSIPKGKFIAEYLGEIITNEEAEKRGTVYDRLKVECCGF
jgi:SET domain-containing protein